MLAGDTITSVETTALKKSEINSRELPPGKVREVSKGVTVKLTAPPTPVDEDYWLVVLANEASNPLSIS